MNNNEHKNDTEKENYREIENLVKSLYEGLNNLKIPQKAKQKIIEEINNLRSFTVDARPARIAIVGRRGAGKSSLINAIFSEARAEIGDVKAKTGKGKWHSYQSEFGELDILDTRGLGEADNPEEEYSENTAIEEVKASIREKCPDAILFLSKAKEVSARIDEDLVQLLELKKTIAKEHNYDVPIVGVVTQVDELSPKSIDKPPFDNDVKQKNISEAMDVLSDKLNSIISSPVKVIPICCYVEFEGKEIVYDIRWNVDKLIEYLIDQLPNEAQLIFAKLSKVKNAQKKVARKIGASVAGITGLIGANPIPIADLPIITGLQTTMIISIALIGGKKVDKKGVGEFLSALGVNVAAGLALREVARQLVKLIPVAGGAVSGAVAAAGTYALCESAIAYFIDKEPIKEVKENYRKNLNADGNEDVS